MNSDTYEKSDRELVVRQFIQREEGIYHPTYDTELNFYEMVSDGNIGDLNRKDDYGDIDVKSRGILSDDKIRNLKYHIIVTVAMISRFCIEKGLDERTSYSLSDFYIKKIDETDSESELKSIHKKLIFDYAKRMKNVHHKIACSIQCTRAMDYIQNHLHENVRLQDIADYVKLERTYLSKLFHAETGMKISDYIIREKIHVAKNMLAYSEFTCTEIAEYLSFSSDSYFGKVFKGETNLTPTAYRKLKYRKHWSTNK